MHVSRRGLLRAGLLGSAAIWAGGVLACACRRSEPPSTASPRAALSPAGEEILRAVIPVALGPLLAAAGPERDQALDAGMLALDDYLAHLSLPLQAEAERVFDTLDLLPARVLLLGTTRRWRDASPAAIERFLHTARDGRLLLLRRMAAFLQSMTVLAWFDQPAAWKGIGYPGPPVGPWAGKGSAA
jgi:hypothetical protein